jgi:hypothetical protein
MNPRRHGPFHYRVTREGQASLEQMNTSANHHHEGYDRAGFGAMILALSHNGGAVTPDSWRFFTT